MKSAITILVLSIIFTVSASAAKSYQGYVVLNNDEKIEGTIEMLSPTLNEVKVKFTATDGKKVTYKAKEVKEYGFKVEKWNSKTRVHDIKTITYVRHNVERAPVAFGATNVLIEREITGAVNMYNHFVEMNKSNYKVVLKEMTAEYFQLSAKIGTKGYGIKYVAKTIAAYNEWMIDNGEEVVVGMR